MKNLDIAKKLRNIDRLHLWHPYSRYSRIQKEDFPIITEATEIYLIDINGKRYIDAISSWWSANLGHRHPQIIEAIIKQLLTLDHSILGNMSHPQAIYLAKELCYLFPDIHRHIFFASDGSSAIEGALKIAIQYWYNIGEKQKKIIVSLKDAYHGDTIGAMSLGFLTKFHKPFRNIRIPFLQVPSPCCNPCPWKMNIETCKCECFNTMRKTLEKEHRKIAAVVIEPLCLCAGGIKIYKPEYLKYLYQTCKELKILLILDEIALAFGRTLKMFAFENSSIDPDIVCLGKGITSGHIPLSAIVVKDYIYETFKDIPEDHTFYHGHTYTGYPPACAAAREALKIYSSPIIFQKASRSALILKETLLKASSIPIVKAIRCMGMIGAIELIEQQANSEIALKIQKTLMKEQILIRPLGNVVYLMLPLITPEEIVRFCAVKLVEAISKFSS